MYSRYEERQECESCIKKDVCKYKEAYERDFANLKEYMTSSESTAISITCKQYSSRVTYRGKVGGDNEA